MKKTSLIPSPFGENPSGIKKSAILQSSIKILIFEGVDLQLFVVIISEYKPVFIAEAFLMTGAGLLVVNELGPVQRYVLPAIVLEFNLIVLSRHTGVLLDANAIGISCTFKAALFEVSLVLQNPEIIKL